MGAVNPDEPDAIRDDLLAAIPVGELRRLADLLAHLEIELADDLLAGLANQALRNLARRWADTVSVWVLEAELWDRERTGAGLAALTEVELTELAVLAAERLAACQGRPRAEVLAELAQRAS
jgi:hypothetical protein